jgi:ribosomal protein L22
VLNVIGSNAAMLFFLDIVSAKTPVSVSKCGQLGSGWAGIEHENYLLDLGQRYFELDFENRQNLSIDKFDARSSQRDFIHLIDNYIRAKGHELKRVRVETYFRKSILACPMESADLRGVVGKFSFQEKKQIQREIANRDVSSKFEMSKVGYQSFKAEQYSLKDMMEHNHGSTFNKIVLEPFGRKFGVDLNNVPLKNRRKLWLPLFYPDTISQCCAEGTSEFKPFRPHFRIKGKSTSFFIKDIIDKLMLSKTALSKALAPEQNSNYHDVLSNKKLEHAFVGGSVEAIAKSLGINVKVKKKKIRVVWLEINGDDVLRHIDYLSVIDGEIPFFRLSSSSVSCHPKKHILCVETFDQTTSVENFITHIKEMGLIKNKTTAKKLKELSAPVIDEPTFENLSSFDNAVKALQRRHPNVNFELSNLNYSNSTLNAQLLTAMKTGMELGLG